MTRKAIARDLADGILMRARHRCCVCPAHRRISNIHHLDQDHSNNSPLNLVGLCSECHADAHTTSTMRRGLTTAQLYAYKTEWEEQCTKISQPTPTEELRTNYYANLERLGTVYKQTTGRSLIEGSPHWFKGGKDSYDSLWANDRNTLDWQQLLSVREYLNDCISQVSESILPLDIGLFESQTASPKEWQGELVTFNCELTGKDIPDQNQLVECLGNLEGPPPTLRREKISEDDQEIFEVCMMLSPRFFYSDSSFIQLSETSRWSGVGICGLLREAVGSNDSYRLRSQLLITPLWIGRGAERTVLSAAI